MSLTSDDLVESLSKRVLEVAQRQSTWLASMSLCPQSYKKGINVTLAHLEFCRGRHLSSPHGQADVVGVSPSHPQNSSCEIPTIQTSNYDELGLQEGEPGVKNSQQEKVYPASTRPWVPVPASKHVK